MEQHPTGTPRPLRNDGEISSGLWKAGEGSAVPPAWGATGGQSVLEVGNSGVDEASHSLSLSLSPALSLSLSLLLALSLSL